MRRLMATARNAADLTAGRWQRRRHGIDACSDVTWSNDFAALSDDCGATGMPP